MPSPVSRTKISSVRRRYHAVPKLATALIHAYPAEHGFTGAPQHT